jgi:RNA polymerase-binding transcription factor DksA
LVKAASKQKKGAVKVADKVTDKLDKRTIDRFRKILLKEREEIIGDVKQIYESSQEVGQDGIQDIGDEAANVYNKQILLTSNEAQRSG